MIRVQPLVASAVLGFLLAGCPPQGLDARQSAGRVSRAIELLRNAPNDQKPLPLAALARLACASADVCKTRDVCVVGYTLHVDAFALIQRAKERLRDGRTPEAGTALITAREKLRDASLKVTDCTEREATLRHRYEL